MNRNDLNNKMPLGMLYAQNAPIQNSFGKNSHSV